MAYARADIVSLISYLAYEPSSPENGFHSQITAIYPFCGDVSFFCILQDKFTNTGGSSIATDGLKTIRAVRAEPDLIRLAIDKGNTSQVPYCELQMSQMLFQAHIGIRLDRHHASSQKVAQFGNGFGSDHYQCHAGTASSHQSEQHLSWIAGCCASPSDFIGLYTQPNDRLGSRGEYQTFGIDRS